jgi:hypothetical protein
VRWNKRSFDSHGLTRYPPGPHLAALTPTLKITVTSIGRWDDIGQVLTSMGVGFDPFDGVYDAAIIFSNCGTADRLDPVRTRAFVENGGCLYASDLESSTVLAAFPELFRPGRSISPGNLTAHVEDAEVADILGPTVPIRFDTTGQVLVSDEGSTILRDPTSGQPIMIEVPAGDGAVFFTSFHNHAQASADERLLLQLLVLKQIGRTTKTSVLAAGRALGMVLTERPGRQR